MPSIRQRKLEDLLAELPNWEALGDVPPCPLFITTKGFEVRSPCCFEKWCERVKGSNATAVLISYPSEQGSSPEQMARFEVAAVAAGVNIIELTYDRLKLYGEVARVLDELPEGPALIDISTAATYVFYPMMAAVREARPRDLSLCYTEAERYFPLREDWIKFQNSVEGLELVDLARRFDEARFQSRGVERVFEAPVFAGYNADNLPTALIVIPNFSYERVNRMIEYAVSRYNLERDRVKWIIGSPPDADENGWRHDALWEMFGRPEQHFPASTLDYKEILVVLHRYWEEQHSREFMMVADLGSKSQHLGVLMFLTMHPEVALVVSEPREFDVRQFSIGSGREWLLRLGDSAKLDKSLREWGRVDFEWDVELSH